jgi:1,4-alpha-glucan branching enzyme
MWTHPGARLLFMGNEFGQTSEWNYKSELQWYLLQFDPHKKLQECVKALNHLLREEPALYEKQFSPEGFQWVDLNNRNECVVVYRRMGKSEEDDILVVLNLNPQPKESWKIEVNRRYKKEIFNSDDVQYYGTGNYSNPQIVCERVDGEKEDESNRYNLVVNLPPLAAVLLK